VHVSQDVGTVPTADAPARRLVTARLAAWSRHRMLRSTTMLGTPTRKSTFTNLVHSSWASVATSFAVSTSVFSCRVQFFFYGGGGGVRKKAGEGGYSRVKDVTRSRLKSVRHVRIVLSLSSYAEVSKEYTHAMHR